MKLDFRSPLFIPFNQPHQGPGQPLGPPNRPESGHPGTGDGAQSRDPSTLDLASGEVNESVTGMGPVSTQNLNHTKDTYRGRTLRISSLPFTP